MHLLIITSTWSSGKRLSFLFPKIKLKNNPLAFLSFVNPNFIESAYFIVSRPKTRNFKRFENSFLDASNLEVLRLFTCGASLRIASSVRIHSPASIYIVVQVTVARIAGEESPTGASADGTQCVAIAIVASIL